MELGAVNPHAEAGIELVGGLIGICTLATVKTSSSRVPDQITNNS